MKAKQFLWIDLAGFCNGMVLYAPVAILVRLNKGVSLSWFFYLQAILSFLIFLLEIPSGILTDKIGYKKSLILNQILLCLCKLIFLIGFGVTFFLLETIIEAIAATFSSGTIDAYIHSFCDSDNDLYTQEKAKFIAFGSTGFIVSTILFSLLYKQIEINGLIFVSLIFSIIGLIFLSISPNEIQVIENGENPVKKIKLIEIVKNLNSNLLVFLILNSLIGLSFIIINFMYILKIASAGLSEELITPIILIYTAGDLIIPYFFKMTEKYSNKILFISTSAICSLIFIIFALLNNLFILIPMVVLPFILSIISTLLDKMENSYINKIHLENQRATILSILNMGNNFLEIIFLFSSALLTSYNQNFIYLSMGIVFFLISLFSLKLNKFFSNSK